MKKIYTLVVALVITASTFAQSPEKMSYQAVVRDAGNAIVSNQAVGMQLSILQGSTAVYVETQTPTTNANGLVSIEIGNGSVVSGTFATIDWSLGTYFIKTETDPTGPFTNYTITGTSQMLSVPYALHAKTASNGIPVGGTDGQVLKIVGGVLVWTDDSAGSIFYEDVDGDGFGVINSFIVAFSAPIGYVSNNTDCNDNDASINPNNIWYLDADGDNYAVSTTTACTSPGTGYTSTVLPLGDCNDSDAALNPDTIWYLDADGDNYAVSTTTGCTSPGVGYTITVLPLGDCNDNEATAFPGATEIFGDGIDNNCNGQIDEAEIGQLRADGVVFYIAPVSTDLDGDGILDIGLVCALSDSGSMVDSGCHDTEWPSVPDVNNYTGTPTGPGAEIGDGMSNTNGILADCPTAPGALAARSLGPEWFLPSINELNEMYLNRATLEAAPGFAPFSWYYLSSTELDSADIWLYDFVDFGYGYNSKSLSGFVRAVRAF